MRHWSKSGWRALPGCFETLPVFRRLTCFSTGETRPTIDYTAGIPEYVAHSRPSITAAEISEYAGIESVEIVFYDDEASEG